MNYTLAAKLPTIAAILKKNREFLGLIPFFLVNSTKKGINVRAYAYILLTITLTAATVALRAQDTPIGFRNEGIYDFLDELATCGHINLNSAVKPYPARHIAAQLRQAEASAERMSPRQRKELEFYLRQYAIFEPTPNNPYTAERRLDLLSFAPRFNFGFLPPGLHYKDSLTHISIRPIWGARYHIGGANKVLHTWGGAEVLGNVGPVTAYASLRDNHMSECLTAPNYFTLSEVGNYKINVQGQGGADFSEMRGGIIYGWRWGSFGLVKDQLQWGSGYHGTTIFGGNNPSFAMIKLQVKPVRWFELNYIHGWLVSEVEDTTRSYTLDDGRQRKVFRDKYIAANFVTFTPYRGINLSVGNSIVYSDIKVQPAYLIPVMFYKSIDHTVNHGIENQNSQMFADISVRTLRHLHVYGTVYCDELSLRRIGNPDRHNFLSWKGGAQLSGWPVANLAIRGELTYVYPLVYKHRVPATTFATNKANLGYYLRDNSREIYAAIDYRPLRGLLVRAEAFCAQHGNEYDYLTKYGSGIKGDELPVMQDIVWQNISMSLTARWEFFHDWWLVASYTLSDIQGFEADGRTAQEHLDMFTPKAFQGRNNVLTMGLNMGW
ncbi:MAG: hypothetical protein IKI28_01365 [Bacteroidales bacterium]|nr:hypothetical protein [Bacteroidales bacterium]